MASWFVAHTAPNREMLASSHLRRQEFEVFLPMFSKTRRHARRVEQVLVPLFPRYLFVKLDLEIDRWRSVNGTIGVSHLICNGDTPISVGDAIVDGLMARTDEKGRVEPAALQILQPGDQLRIIEGAMLDQVGAFERMTADQRVVLLMNVLGRDVRVSMPIAAVDAA